MLHTKNKLLHKNQDMVQVKITREVFIGKLDTVKLGTVVDEDPHARVKK